MGEGCELEMPEGLPGRDVQNAPWETFGAADSFGAHHNIGGNLNPRSRLVRNERDRREYATEIKRKWFKERMR